MTGSTFHFDFKDLKLTVPQIERVLGYEVDEAKEIVEDIIPAVLHESEKISLIKGEYRIFDNIEFIENEKSVKILDQRFNIGKIIYGQLKKSDSVAVFLCTAGEAIGLRSNKEMKNGDMLTGYVFDVVGSEIVELAADLMQKELGNMLLKEEKKISNRFSPGYCGWDVAEQQKLFSLMPYNFCGIRLTPSALMDPVKSISGFIGIGRNVKRAPYTCNLCDMKDCIYRKTREG
jgi:hypothetical protein